MNYELLFTKAPTALLLFNDVAQVIHSNYAAQKLFDYTLEELNNFGLFDLVPAQLTTLAKTTWQEFLEAKRQESFTIIKTKLNQLHYVSYSTIANIEPGLHCVSLHPIGTHANLTTSEKKKKDLIQTLNNFLQEGFIERAATRDYELSKLIATEKHFYNLFKNVPAPIIEADCSSMKEHLIKNKDRYGTDPKQYFIDNPDETYQIILLRKVHEINKAALRFFKIKHDTDISDLQKIHLSQTKYAAPVLFEGILNNSKEIICEAEVCDLMGEMHTVKMHVSPKSADYKRTFFTFEDISETKRIQEKLEYHVNERTVQLEETNKKLRREITYREQITRELHSSEERYRQLYTIYPVGIFHIDSNHITTYTNPKLSEIEGATVEELKNGRWTNYIHPEDKERVVTSWQDAFHAGQPLNIEYRFKHGAKITWVNVQTVPEHDDAGQLVGHVGIVSDITRLHQAEEQLKQTQTEMAHFARVNAMGEVASGIAHELNQPLTAISNFMSGCKRRLLSLTEPKIPQDILDAIENAATQAQRAGNIIHNLKDFLRKGELKKQAFNLNNAIQDVIIFSKKSVSENHITIKLKLEKKLPEINADKIHIEQVILNIVNNAIDAINESKRTTKEIIIRTKLYKNNFVRISIGDTGMGITKDLIRNIFNPFVTTKPEGMGIGLSLCHNIIDKHQGTISVVSRRGKGAIFHITLPVE
jgi:PAS domain S-box-containing protein